ncbi:hypothetical protein EGW08_006164, partial [Elysia chlorotica]
MPGETSHGSLDCQIRWESCGDGTQTEGVGTSRRVSRGLLKQEADSERRRRGFVSLDRTDPPWEGTRAEARGGRGQHILEKDLDVFSSPFRALAESCGFKVIQEEDGSDTNSVRSQAGSVGPESDDASCSGDLAGDRAVDKARLRRDTPGLHMKASRAPSPLKVGSSSGGDTDDSPGLSESNLVMRRQRSLGPHACHVDSPDHLNRARGENPRNHEQAARSKKTTSCHETRPGHNSRTHNKTKDMVREEDIYYQCRKGQEKSQIDSVVISKESGTQRRKTKDYPSHRSRDSHIDTVDGPFQIDGDCFSDEETGSSTTYQTVREITSSEEAGTENPRRTRKMEGSVTQRYSDDSPVRHGKLHDFNESSSLKDQTTQKSERPYIGRQPKIFMETIPDRHLRAETEKQIQVSPETKTKTGTKNVSRGETCKQSCERQTGDDSELQSKSRGTQSGDNTQPNAPRRRGEGASFRISRKVTGGTIGSSCGVIRYLRSGPDEDIALNRQKRLDFFKQDTTDKCGNKYGTNQSAACLGGGDGNITLDPSVNARMTNGTGRETNCEHLSRTDTTQKSDKMSICARRNKCCEEKDEEQKKNNAEESQRLYRKCSQKDVREIKKGSAKPSDLQSSCEPNKNRHAVEMQVLSEISKLRSVPTQVPERCDPDSAENSRRTSSGVKNQTKNTQTLGFRQSDDGTQSVLSDWKENLENPDHELNAIEETSKKECYSDDNWQRNLNPLSPAPPDSEDQEPGYIYQQEYRDDDPEHTKSSKFNPSHGCSQINHPRINNQQSKTAFAPGNDCQCQTCRSAHHQHTKQNHGCWTKNSSHQDTHVQSKSPHSQIFKTDDLNGIPKQRSFDTSKQQVFIEPVPSRSQCENLWAEHTTQSCYRTTEAREPSTTTPDRHEAVNDPPKPNTSCNKIERTNRMHYIRKSCIQSSEDDTSKHQQPLPLPLSHHKDSGFNINFNYEGSEEGDGGTFGSRFIGQYFLELWKNQCLCDVRLRVGNWSYLAHKIVLAAFSDFFCPNDPHCMPSICFDIPNATPDAVHQILLYLYTSEMEITDHTLDSVLCAAQSLGVTEVVNLVKEILDNPTAENFDHYLEIRSRHGFPGRLSDYTDLIREYLLDLTTSPYFLQFDLSDLQQILGDPEVKVDSEADIIDVIARWIEYNPMERIQHSADLLAFVNFDCIPAETLAEVVERKRHVFSREAFSIFLDAFKARSVSAEGACGQNAQPNAWTNSGAMSQGGSQSKLPNATNKSTNADIFRPQQQQQQQPPPYQQPMCYDLGDSNLTQSRTFNGGISQDNFRSPSRARRDNTRIPRSCQNRISAILSRGSRNSWASDAGTSRPSSGMSSRQSSVPRRFATTQNNRVTTPREIMSMASRGDCEPAATWGRPGNKYHRVGRGNNGCFGGGGGGGYREPIGVPSDTTMSGGGFSRGRRGSSGVYRCSNGNAGFSP